MKTQLTSVLTWLWLGPLSVAAPIQWSVIEESELIPATVSPSGEQLGTAVAVDGDTAVVGVPNNVTREHVRVLERSAGVWTEVARLYPSAVVSPLLTNRVSFGASVGLSGDTVVVGAPNERSFTTGEGAVFVFRRVGTTWTEEAKLGPTGRWSWENFGSSVAVHGDRVLVGVADDYTVGASAGAAYMFSRSGTTWSLDLKVIPSSLAAGDLFGTSVALSANRAVVGAPGEDNPKGNDAGAAWVFEQTGTAWSAQKLTAAGSGNGSGVGSAVAIDGDTLVIGAADWDGGAGASAGAAIAFEHSGATWTETATLLASDAAAGDEFGRSASLSGDGALIGAPLRDEPAGVDAGAAYLFTRTGTSWTEAEKLTASDGATQDGYGSSVGLSGTRPVVGAPYTDQTFAPDSGSAYFYETSGGPALEQTIHRSDVVGLRERFGSSVSIEGDRAIVGDPFCDDGPAVHAGAGFVFLRQGGEWSEEARLQPTGAESSDNFGVSASFDGDTAVFGAPNADDPFGVDSGAAYAYVRSGTDWTLQAKLTTVDSLPSDFGVALDLDGDTLVVGAYKYTHAGFVNAGAAYVFQRSGSVWTEVTRLVSPDPGLYALFGVTVGISGDTIVIGEPGGNGAGLFTGVAYVFDGSGSSWTLQQELSAPSTTPSDFGESVAIHGDRILVGDPSAFVGGSGVGNVSTFRRNGTSWLAGPVLSDPSTFDFGAMVATDGDVAVVGAPGTGPLVNQGAAQAFVREGTGWAPAGQFRGSRVDEGDSFGAAVDVQGSLLLVGAMELEYYVEGAGTNEGPGTAYAFVLAPDAPETYCTAGTSASGCAAVLGFAGVPSANAPAGFQLIAADVEGAKNGIFFYGANGRQAIPWGNGSSLRCIVPPVQRAGALIGVGTPGACDGLFTQDLNALWSANPAKNPGVAAVIDAQLWYRDPLSTSNRTTSFSGALEFLVGP